ncbi:uncharacterized protein LOC122504801 [Leptopilina heterotoma]|uniref:uncharacterized protein LOC122504801 n=1 Tax=Leptopilina heterotoma TaxID=63436 RepID=UPI001CAA0E1E|nr:uncharacterized protein LOC122504801 [Leptopilina heterotoma]
MRKWGKYTKKYCVSWEKDPQLKGWLQRSEETDILNGKTEAFCKLCKVHLRAHKNDLIRHASRPVHLQNEKSFDKRQQPNLHNFAIVKVNEEMKILDLKLAMYVSMHCSISSIDHLTNLLKLLGKGTPIENLKLHRTKCSQLITSVIAPTFLKDLVTDVGDSPYAIIADEVTDISVTKFMGLCTRFFCKRRQVFITDFLGIIEVVSCTGKNLALALIDFLESIRLPLNQLQAIGTDGAPAMCGSENSFYTHLKERVPHLQLLKCVCHSLHECAEYAYKIFPDSISYLTQQTYNWFAHSALRLNKYENFYKNKTDGKTPGKLVSLSKTRWLVWLSACSQILYQWHELKKFFNMQASNNDFMAKMIFAQFTQQRSPLQQALQQILFNNL